MTKLSDWVPCTECGCPNHHLPSYSFNLPTKLCDNPDWARLSHSNDAPSPGEESALLAMISSYDSQLQSLELEESDLQILFHDLKAQMKALSHKMGTLRRQRARISEAIRERRKILDPVRRLPSEILHRVFLDIIDFPVHHTQSGSNNNHWAFHPTESSLWSITAVSKSWRDVALTSLRLWSFVNISITDSAFDDLTYVRRLGLQLHRAIKYPLSVSICDIDAESSYDEIPPQLTAILFSFASSIRELHLYLPTVLLSDFTRLQLSSSSLESLVIICTDGIELPNYGPLNLFSFVPKLHSLQVIDVTDSQASFEPPWHLVKEYQSDHAFCPEYPSRLIGPRAHNHLAVLRSLEQVEECVLRLGDASQDEFGDAVFPLVCPQLRSLELSSWNIDEEEEHSVFQQVADRLTLPSLSVLKVSCAEKGNEETAAVFTSICHLLLRSHSAITVFHLHHCRVLSEDLLQPFCSTPTLEDVRLIRTNHGLVTAEIIQELTLDHSSFKALVLPRLHTLYISGTPKFSSQNLIRMVKSRWSSGERTHGVERLLTLKMCGRYLKADGFRQKILPELKGCIERGFSFEIGPCVSK